MSQNKSSPRNLAVGLAVACIILVIALAGVVANYSSVIGRKDTHINDLNSEVSSRNQQISDLQNQIALDSTSIDSLNATIVALQSQAESNNSTINSLNAQISTLQSQVSSLNSQITTLQNREAANNSTVSSLQSQVASVNAQLGSLQTWLSRNLSQLASANAQVSSLNSQVNNLQSQVSNLTAITNMAASTIWVEKVALNQPANSDNSWNFPANYAGEVFVNVTVAQPYSSSTNLYVTLQYWSLWLQPNYNVTLPSSGGIAVFPVVSTTPLPMNLAITVGTNATSNIQMTVTITYVY